MQKYLFIPNVPISNNRKVMSDVCNLKLPPSPPPDEFLYKAPIKPAKAWPLPGYYDPEKPSSMKKQLKEYAQSTSIHGFAYIGEDGRSIIER